MERVTKVTYGAADNPDGLTMGIHMESGKVHNMIIPWRELHDHVGCCLKAAEHRAHRLPPVPPADPKIAGDITRAHFLTPTTVAYSRQQTGPQPDVSAIIYQFGQEVSLCFQVDTPTLRDLLTELHQKISR